MKCTACFKELGKNDVLYTEDKLPYCKNPFTCDEGHPNSVENIVKRLGAVRMFTKDELKENLFDILDLPEETKGRILKIATKPQSIRLSKYEIAYYLILLQESKKLSSISEAVRYCVNLAMEVEPLEAVEKEPEEPEVFTEQEPEPQPEPQIVEKSPGVKIVVPDMPKSINVDWDNLPPLEKEPVPVPDDDEFTF